MKPTKSKLLPLNSNAYWWSNEKSVSFYFKRGERWFILRSSKPTEKPTEKPTNLFQKPKKSEKTRENYNNYPLLLGMAAILGISLGLNLLAFLLLK